MEVAGTVTCVVPQLLAGDDVDVTITASIDSGFTGTLPNTASVTASTPDPIPADNTVTIEVPVSAVADLAITKSVSPDPIVPGTNATYTIVVTNRGPSDSGALVTDTLPSSLAFSTADAACTASGAAVTCDLGILPLRRHDLAHHQRRGAPRRDGCDRQHRDRRGNCDRSRPGERHGHDQHADRAGGRPRDHQDGHDHALRAGRPALVRDHGRQSRPVDRDGRPRDGSAPADAHRRDVDVRRTNCATSSGTGSVDTTVTLAPGARSVITVTAIVAPGTTGAVVNVASVEGGGSTQVAGAEVMPGRSISGHVFDDLNRNGRLDPGEPDIARSRRPAHGRGTRRHARHGR